MALDAQKPETAIERELRLMEYRMAEEARIKQAAERYAGENPMEHHKSGAPRGGMAGAGDIFSSLGSIELRKFKAGECLVTARLYRALGHHGGAKIWLNRAIAWRSQATEMVAERRAAA